MATPVSRSSARKRNREFHPANRVRVYQSIVSAPKRAENCDAHSAGEPSAARRAKHAETRAKRVARAEKKNRKFLRI